MMRPRGQALVEFTLVVVFLLLLMAGTVDVVRAVTIYALLTNGAQEGATYGALHPTDTTGIATRVRESIGSVVNPAGLNVTVQYHTRACPGEVVEVRATTTMKMIFPFAEVFDPDRSVTLTASARQTILNSENPSCP